jgi:Predicted membrane protein
MNNSSSIKLKFIIYTGLSIAMVALATMAIKIPSIKGGYINFGDIMIFITAAFLGKTAGFLAGGIGSAMADILLTYTIYAPATFIIKGLEGLMCALLIGNINKAKPSRLIIAMAVSAAWMVFGYFMYEYKIGSLLFANPDFGAVAAIANLLGNILQGAVSAAAALPFILTLRKTGISFDR